LQIYALAFITAAVLVAGTAMDFDSAPSVAEDEGRHGCFPIPLLVCCPSMIQNFIPGTWRKIQDLTHFSLVLGVIGSVVLLGEAIYNIVNFTNHQPSPLQITKGCLSFIFVLPCLFYFVRIIGQYDDRLQAKQRDAKKQKEMLTQAYNDLLADMDGLLTKSAESSAGLAERSFESKRRDFQRFLERAKSRYSQMFSGSKVENQKLMENFRRFVLNWLRVFEECSIDPIRCPKRVVTVEELQRCMTISEVCDLTLERLRVTEVKFISIQRDQDAQSLKKHRNEFKRMTVAPGAGTLAALEGGMGHAGRPLTTELAPSGSQASKCSWLSCGSSGCRFIKTADSSDGYPRDIQCICSRIVILSREHGMLLAGFIVAPIMILVECLMTEENSSWLGIVDVALNWICIIVLLTRFEEIDIIQQLEREVAELKKAESNVQNQREKMQDFWSQAQSLTELWLYRTVPRMDLYKEVHSHLEDAPNDLINQWMSTANGQLEMIDHNLGELEDWKDIGALSLDAKKTFGKTINGLCQEADFEQMSKKLENMAKHGMQCLQ